MLLGLDIGTSSCKTTILDSQSGTVVASARHPLNYLYPDDTRAEINPEDLWNSVLNVLSQIAAEQPKAVANLKAMAVSIVFPTLVPLAADGTPLHNAILYNDRRAQPQVDDILNRFGQEHFENLIGNRLVPGTSILPGILWLKQNRPDLTAHTKTYATLGAFIIQRLTGVLGMDVSHASLSALCPSGHEEQWASEALAAADIQPSQLPPVHEGLTVAGQLLPHVAQTTGLPRNLAVVWSFGDAPLAAFGAGVAFPGQVFAAGGSTDGIMVCSDRPSGNPLFCNLRHLPARTWVANGSMTAAGASVKWLCDTALKCPVDIAMSEAATAPAGSNGLVFLPYILGERTPIWDSRARGVFFGLSNQTGRAELSRAVLEGVACGWRQIIDLLEETFAFRPSEIVTAGGGSGNLLWNQIKASILNRPVISLQFNDVSSLGACLAAGIASGVYSSLQEAYQITTSLRNPTVIEPVQDWVAPLEDTFQRYVKLYPAVKPLFHS